MKNDLPETIFCRKAKMVGNNLPVRPKSLTGMVIYTIRHDFPKL